MSFEVLLRDLTSKQELIERLTHEVDQHSQVLQRVSTEVDVTRREVAGLEAEKRELQESLQLFSPNILLDTKSLFEIDREALVFAHVRLLQTYKLYVERNRQHLERVQRLQNNLIEKNALDLSVARLQQAHAAQQAFKASLEAKLKDIPALKAMVKRQEKAITLLEQMAKTNATMPPHHRVIALTSDADVVTEALGQTVVESPAFTLLAQENAQLEATLTQADARLEHVQAEWSTDAVATLQAKIETEKLEIRSLEAQLRNVQKYDSGQDELETLREEVLRAEGDAKRKEEEMLALVERLSNEVADLQLRAFEAEALPPATAQIPASPTRQRSPAAASSRHSSRPHSGVRLQPLQ